MNYGGDAADQIVRYSMEGVEHTLRISGSIAKNLAVLIVAVMKDQKKTRGKTNLLRMLKEQRAMKFFHIPHSGYTHGFLPWPYPDNRHRT